MKAVEAQTNKQEDKRDVPGETTHTHTCLYFYPYVDFYRNNTLPSTLTLTATFELGLNSHQSFEEFPQLPKMFSFEARIQILVLNM